MLHSVVFTICQSTILGFFSIQRVNENMSNFTPGKQQSKKLILLANIDKKSLETEFLIVICH